MSAIDRYDVIPISSSSLHIFPRIAENIKKLHFFISANPFGILAAHHITLCSGVTSVMGCYRTLFHLHCDVNHLINEFSASGNLFHFDGTPVFSSS